MTITTFVSIGILMANTVFSQRDLNLINEYFVPLTELSGIMRRLSETSHDKLMIAAKTQDNQSLPLFNQQRALLEDSFDQIDGLLQEIGLQISVDRTALTQLQIEVTEDIRQGRYSAAIERLKSPEYLQAKEDILSQSAGLIEKVTEYRDQVTQESIARNFRAFAIVIILLIIWLASLFRVFHSLRTNIRERRKTFDRLHQSKMQVENLLRVLSHDISTPLMAVMSISEVQTSGKNTIRDGWERTFRASKNIAEIIDHVRKMQAVADGKVEFTLTSVNLKKALLDVQNIFLERLAKKKIQLTIQSSVNDEVMVLADENSLKNQVLNNVISNAIKFSDEGSEVCIEIEQDDSWIILKVIDRGVGMPEDILENLFNPFKKTSRSGTEGESGTGFGMPLVKSYVEKFQGEVSVHSITSERSPKNHGTTIRLKLKEASP